jgi:anti-sigma28 factor (negative regulator of flagellin synthesis)
VPHLDGCATEIRTFYSLREIRENVESDINRYKTLLDDYSQWLGSLLRNPESVKNQEWTKKTAELQKVLKTGNKKSNTKKEEKKAASATDWVQFRDVMLSADDMGEAEVLFEAVEELKNKIDRLEKAKTSIADLEKYGLGKELLYVTYIHDGIPEKIFFKPKTGVEAAEKFAFMADFSVAKEIS